MSVETARQRVPVTRGRLPLGVYLLAFSLFAMGSAEFLLAGVLPAIADDLQITLSSAGALISAFAIGVVIGGPPLAIMTLRWPRRTTLVTTQILFAASVTAGLLTDNYAVLLATRVLCGLAYAGYWAVAAVTAISLVTPDRTARASGVVVSDEGEQCQRHPPVHQQQVHDPDQRRRAAPRSSRRERGRRW